MMTTKLQNYIQLAGQTAAGVTQSSGHWKGFLLTASRLYRYPFPDQLMIHAQRPDATACAEYDLWKKRIPKMHFGGPPKPAQTGRAGAVNFRITDDHLGEGGPKARFLMNINAVKTLKRIESEGRAATPGEQDTLSRYVGWGGLPDAFEPDKAGWAKEYKELRELLTAEEYASARQSTLNAHYTCPAVIKAVYGAVGGMGFKSGRILEPSCGGGPGIPGQRRGAGGGTAKGPRRFRD